MPLKTPSSTSKASGKPKGKTVTPSEGKSKAPAAKAKPAVRAPQQPEPVSPGWWASLSPERKLDVVGAVMSVVGILTLLVLFSAQRSDVTKGMLNILTLTFGWGIYI